VEKCNPTASELTLLQNVNSEAQRLRISVAFKKFQVSSFRLAEKWKRWKSVIQLHVNCLFYRKAT
jgi:hypothetical protein